MYEIMKLMDELRVLKEKVKGGEQCQATINRIFEIEMLLANVYYIDLG